jgi:hypothetical protein
MEGIGVIVGVGKTGVEVLIGTGASVGVEIDAGAQETRATARMTVSNVLDFIFSLVSRLEDKRLTVCVTRKWAGVDSLWEQKKLEARKMLENAAESHTSGARFVGLCLVKSLLHLP